jgi:hypothetical protein
LPHPPQGRSATGKPPFDTAGAAGTLNCFSNCSLPQLGQAGFSLDRTSNSKAAPQATHSYSYNGMETLRKTDLSTSTAIDCRQPPFLANLPSDLF